MKLSIVGTGKIVEEVLQMLHRDFQGAIEVTGILSREKSVEHAIDLCMAYAPTGFVFTDLDRMLAEAEADFVYVANANHVHHPYALRALLAGHNVIIEKPVAMNRLETEQLLDAALQHGCHLLPAFSMLYMPLFEQLVQVLPQLGPIHVVDCNYSQFSSRYERYLRGELTPAFDPACGGGALMDINIYNLAFAIALFGPPYAMHYMPNRGWNSVDTSGTLLLRYATFAATLTGAKDCDGPSHGYIEGEHGYVEIPGSVSTLSEFTLHLRGHEPQTFRATDGLPGGQLPHRLSHEFEQFRRLADEPERCHINVPFLIHTIREIAIAQERMNTL